MSGVLVKAVEISREYTDSTGFKIRLFEGLNFEIKSGEASAFLAQAGAGKSALLRILCGIEKVSSGSLEFDKNDFIYFPAKGAYLPWLDTMENVRFFRKNVSDENINAALELTGLAGYGAHIPHPKSHGYIFRVMAARAIADGRRVMCFDEPFSLMEPKTSEEVYSLVKALVKQGYTIVLATGSVEEAARLSDVVYVMSKNPGRIIKKVELKDKNTFSYGESYFNTYRNLKETLDNS